MLNLHPPSGHQTLNAIAHRFERVLILELEPATSEEAVSFPDLYPLVHTFFAKLRKASSVEDLAQFAAEETRRLTGFDHVLVYKFDSSWHGRVIGEALGGNYPLTLIFGFLPRIFLNKPVSFMSGIGFV